MRRYTYVTGVKISEQIPAGDLAGKSFGERIFEFYEFRHSKTCKMFSPESYAIFLIKRFCPVAELLQP